MRTVPPAAEPRTSVNTMLVAPPSSTPGTKPQYSAGTVPNAFGGPSNPPALWAMIIAYVKGRVWPNGHQDQLRAAANAWREAGRTITASVQYLSGALEKLQTQRAPEIADITTAFTTLNQQCVAVGQQFEAIAQACDDYATHLDNAHHEIIQALIEFIAITVAIEAAAAAAAAASGGSSAAAAQGLNEVELALTGTRIARIIDLFCGIVRGLSLFGGRVTPALEASTAKLATYSSAAPVIATLAKEGEPVSNGFGTLEKLRRVSPNAAVRKAVLDRTERVTIGGQEFYVNGADRKIAIPVSGKYADPAIAAAPKVSLYPGGPLRYYQYQGRLYPIDTRVVMGHDYGVENWRMIAEHSGKMTQKEFNQMMQNPEFYRIEDYYGNASHLYEKGK